MKKERKERKVKEIVSTAKAKMLLEKNKGKTSCELARISVLEGGEEIIKTAYDKLKDKFELEGINYRKKTYSRTPIPTEWILTVKL